MNNSLSRNLALEAVRITEAAALSSSLLMGRGDEKAADSNAVNAMRFFLNKLSIEGTVVIGEGERDNAPMLYIGEKVGAGGPKVDIALDPLEGTTITANGGENALSVIAMAEDNGFLHSPDVYMDKIAVGKKYEDVDINFDMPPDKIVFNLSKKSGVDTANLVVCILDRPRHKELIQDIRKTGARIKLIMDGDVSAVISTTIEDSGVDLYIGSGGAPEGVLAAAALRCLGGKIIGKLLINNENEKKRAIKSGIKDFNKIYSTSELASGDVMFAATGVTDGTLLKGVRITNNIAKTHSIVMRSKTKTVRFIEAIHNLTNKKIIQ
ncbi:MAG: Fructose-1,6-bisphosphatase class 2 [Alphaproteobacteria bacterium MarineAlpha5_Bin11]|nr:fructose-bisphosphatase class II [Pelagibacteraceae bacterium]PPR44087.1 MAG: Fructose-1,6-bisphosphatase class 2 [Alphaproteobacteria bacterium MarineAlpha5_Bin11]|tara:strand:- start:2285 stop:3253 length:969 start_codon:yes stop_codon:yes gene_type:complete